MQPKQGIRLQNGRNMVMFRSKVCGSQLNIVEWLMFTQFPPVRYIPPNLSGPFFFTNPTLLSNGFVVDISVVKSSVGWVKLSRLTPVGYHIVDMLLNIHSLVGRSLDLAFLPLQFIDFIGASQRALGLGQYHSIPWCPRVPCSSTSK